MQTTGNLGLKKPEGTDLVDIADLNGNMDILDTAVNGKVEKITGKQLSTNDYTATEKTKLAGIATGANNYTHPNHTGDVTSTGDGVTAIAAGVIVNADVNAAAGIDATKIGTGTVSNAEFGYLDGVTSAIQTQINTKTGIVDYVRQPGYAATAGTLSAYTATLTPAPTSVVEGFGITIVPNVTNGASPTLNVNGLGAVALKDQKGVAYAAGKLLAGKPYMFRKVGTDFLADSSGGAGDALAGDIRAGKKAATDAGDIVGSLVVQTGGTVTPTASNIVKPAGIYDTAITVAGVAVPAAKVLNDTTIAGVTGTMAAKTGLTDATSSAWDGNYLYARTPLGGYTVQGGIAGQADIRISAAQARADTNIIASNIRNGTWIYGVVGTLVEGKRMATGTTTSSGSETFWYVNNSTGATMPSVSVSGLSFQPRVIFLMMTGGGSSYTIYEDHISDNYYAKSVKVFNWYNNGYDSSVVQNFKGDTVAYSNVGGFKMPVVAGGYSYAWFAYE
ncbi:hypothetical protein [Paenibacillus wynnii]|uniref:hypothetical protein n=1 Tax=Paenibacillus wynnii TaxID=268407 RepID=UPI0027910428|nr:hypothetical protein [Paenibacillus wynnii]MDQ0195810.1 hypothetical protein [Paenibacillus wynnii]